MKTIFYFFTGPNRLVEYENRVARLADMGVEEQNARAVLSSNNWDLERATEAIFS